MQSVSTPSVRIPEAHKREGVYYAITDDGVELPIVDIGHPAFAISLDDGEQRARIDAFLRESQPLERVPPFLRRGLLKLLLRGSVLGRAIGSAGSSFLSGMNTYLCKLGPENLGEGYSKPIDRKIAAALPVFAMRLRLQDMARQLAEGPGLGPDPSPSGSNSSADRPLYFVNIAGGPAMDSINALLLLRREHPRLLDGRHIEIVVLDRDAEGPHFGRRALAALSTSGAPLEGLDVRFRHLDYDWSKPSGLIPVLEEARSTRALVLASSEGGLFEYGTDDEIVDNLRTLRAEAGDDCVFVGSVTRADEPMQKLRRSSKIPTRPRGHAAFRLLAERGGFRVDRVIERPFSDHVTLRPRQSHNEEHV